MSDKHRDGPVRVRLIHAHNLCRVQAAAKAGDKDARRSLQALYDWAFAVDAMAGHGQLSCTGCDSKIDKNNMGAWMIVSPADARGNAVEGRGSVAAVCTDCQRRDFGELIKCLSDVMKETLGQCLEILQ